MASALMQGSDTGSGMARNDPCRTTAARHSATAGLAADRCERLPSDCRLGGTRRDLAAITGVTIAILRILLA